MNTRDALRAHTSKSREETTTIATPLTAHSECVTAAIPSLWSACLARSASRSLRHDPTRACKTCSPPAGERAAIERGEARLRDGLPRENLVRLASWKRGN